MRWTESSAMEIRRLQGILFNIDDIKFTKNSGDAEKALMLYFGKMLEKDS